MTLWELACLLTDHVLHHPEDTHKTVLVETYHESAELHTVFKDPFMPAIILSATP